MKLLKVKSVLYKIAFKMAAFVGSIVSQLVNENPASKAFRPWWDNFEEKLIYGLLTLGKSKMCFRVVTFFKKR